MNIYILRHGIAVDRETRGVSNDADRVLTPKGKHRVGQIAKAMRAMELSFDLILSSPYLRARQTAEIVAGGLKARKRLEMAPDLTPGGSVKDLVELLNKRHPQPHDVLLVGHEPYLSELISLLISGHQTMSLTMKKGGLAKLTTDGLKHGRCASLEWLLTPKLMAPPS